MKYYVVLKGRKPGVYNSWRDCEEQVSRYKGSEFRSYTFYQAALDAFEKFTIKKQFDLKKLDAKLSDGTVIYSGPSKKSILISSFVKGDEGFINYKGTYLETNEILFQSRLKISGPKFIAEFLGIAEAFRYIERNSIDIPVFTESESALQFVLKKKYRHFKVPYNEALNKAISIATEYLNTCSKLPKVHLWYIKKWGFPSTFLKNNTKPINTKNYDTVK